MKLAFYVETKCESMTNRYSHHARMGSQAALRTGTGMEAESLYRVPSSHGGEGGDLFDLFVEWLLIGIASLTLPIL